MTRRSFVGALFSFFGWTKRSEASVVDPLDYDRAIHLDAENLAEFGIKDAYEEVAPVIAEYDVTLAPLIEHISEDQDSYSVSVGAKRYDIYDASTLDTVLIDELWGLAMTEFFKLINDQLTETPFRFYALYGGNDLTGIVLTSEQAEAARAAIAAPEQWPYFPEKTGPWYGQYHSSGKETPWWVGVTRKLKG